MDDDIQPNKQEAPKEAWRDVVGFEGRYQVSSFGRVRSLFRYCKVLRGRNSSGYRQVTLFDLQHKRFQVYVHVLVAEAFLSPRGLGMEVNHINHVRADNNLQNLAWVTRAQNVADALPYYRRGEEHCNSRLSEMQVREILKAVERGEQRNIIGRRYGISGRSVHNIRTGATWKHIHAN